MGNTVLRLKAAFLFLQEHTLLLFLLTFLSCLGIGLGYGAALLCKPTRFYSVDLEVLFKKGVEYSLSQEDPAVFAAIYADRLRQTLEIYAKQHKAIIFPKSISVINVEDITSFIEEAVVFDPSTSLSHASSLHSIPQQ